MNIVDLNTRRSQAGTVLALTLVVMMIMSALIAGLGREIFMDLGISRNARIRTETFNWAESGLHMAQEMFQYAVENRVNAIGTTRPIIFGNNTYSITNNGDGLLNTNSSATNYMDLNSPEGNLAGIKARYLGTIHNDGGSVIIAAGYQGAGKGAGSGPSMINIYELTSNSTSPAGGLQRVGEVYGLSLGGY